MPSNDLVAFDPFVLGSLPAQDGGSGASLVPTPNAPWSIPVGLQATPPNDSTITIIEEEIVVVGQRDFLDKLADEFDAGEIVPSGLAGGLSMARATAPLGAAGGPVGIAWAGFAGFVAGIPVGILSGIAWESVAIIVNDAVDPGG